MFIILIMVMFSQVYMTVYNKAQSDWSWNIGISFNSDFE